MKAGNFNIYSYLEKLNEESEMAEPSTQKVDTLGMVIPEENIKTYNWLKNEYQKGKTEVKVEMNMGGSKFEPGYEMQGNIKSVDTFKPGMYGNVKTGDTPPEKKEVTTGTEAKKPEEGKKPAVETPKKVEKSKTTKVPEKNIEGDKKGKTLNFDLKTKKNDKS